MSASTIKQTLPARREQYEIARLQKTLNERNQQLQTIEQQLANTEISQKHARQNMRMLMAFCVVLVLAMIFGGAK